MEIENKITSQEYLLKIMDFALQIDGSWEMDQFDNFITINVIWWKGRHDLNYRVKKVYDAKQYYDELLTRYKELMKWVKNYIKEL